MFPISLDPEISKKLGAGMSDGTAELPFPVVYMWTVNGQASYKAAGDAQYFGGWACKAEEMQTVAEQQALPIPPGWKHVTVATRDGSEYEAYVIRSIFVAPIAKRESWLLDGRRSSNYLPGGRRHVQVLAYMAEAQTVEGERSYIPWGPVVLTAKGYQARNLLESFGKWNKATASVRAKIAPGVPAQCFYALIGTHGKERVVEQVGKSGAQSPITPISVYIPETLSEKILASLYVGGDVASIMADLYDQAADWLAAWKIDAETQPAGPDNFDPAWNMEYPAEDVPF